MYNNFEELLKYCTANACPISEAVMRNEERLTGRTRDEIMNNLRDMYSVMSAEAEKALDKPLSAGFSLIAGQASTQNAYAKAGDTICGDMINRLMARALSCSETNAAMGRICAAPTAGSCGIVPAVIITLSEQLGADEEKTLRALAAASGVGAVVIHNATVAGAEGGCQAECGVAAAMAAAAAVQLCGGTLPQMLSAFSHALSACMGLVCDPVAGLVQVPCAQRNASQAVSALVSADQALAGQVFPIPADQMVGAMYRVGRQLPPELKETAQGGIAATDRGKEIAREIHKGA